MSGDAAVAGCAPALQHEQGVTDCVPLGRHCLACLIATNPPLPSNSEAAATSNSTLTYNLKLQHLNDQKLLHKRNSITKP